MDAVTEQRLRAAVLTYDEVGATISGRLPDEYAQLRVSRPIGRGTVRFEEAAGRLMSWEMHRRSGMEVVASTDQVAVDEVVLLRMTVARIPVVAPCRVVSVLAEPRRRGFAYGTLPGHPERGEESFLVEIDDDEQVTAHVVAFSAPASVLTRAAGPIARRVQDLTTSRYLAALT